MKSLPLLFLYLVFQDSCLGRFEPNWESLDKRVPPAWYSEAKVGVFIHWGVYSIPSFGADHELAEWFWYVWKSKSQFAKVVY